MMLVVMLLPLTGWAGGTSKIDEEENLFIVNTYISWLAKNLSFCKPRRHLDLRGEEGIPKMESDVREWDR